MNTPEGLVGSAWALCNLGEALERWKQEPQQIELAYHQAAIAGRESTHTEGLVAAALALLNLGAELVAWGREPQEIEATFRGAAAAGRQSATPEGLMMTAGAFFGLGEALEGWGREPQEIEAAWRGAATAARESTHPGSLVIAARALLCLGKALEGWGREPQEIEAAWRDAELATAIAQKLGVGPFEGKASDVPAPRMTSLVGEAVFDYSAHDGRYVIGRGTLEFETKWSRASNESIHVYNDPPSINGVALAPHEYTSIQQVVNAESLDYTSRHRTPRVGQIVVLRNENGFYAAVHLITIKYDTRGDDHDELRFQYAIQADGSGQLHCTCHCRMKH